MEDLLPLMQNLSAQDSRFSLMWNSSITFAKAQLAVMNFINIQLAALNSKYDSILLTWNNISIHNTIKTEED